MTTECEYASLNGYTNHGCRCTECRVAKAMWTAQRRQVKKNMVNAIKLNSGCIDCGYDDNPAALDFDHISTDKRNNVANMLTLSDEVLLAEIEKCEVRCANCHRVRSQEQLVRKGHLHV